MRSVDCNARARSWIERSAPPALQVARPHVWLVSLADSSTAECNLTVHEQARADRIIDARTRHRWTSARCTLRRILAAYLGGNPEDIPLATTSTGKPYLTPSSNSCELTFNLSHSDDLALVAVGWKEPLGVDVERVLPFAEMDSLVADHFSSDECAAISVSSDRDVAFYRCWTRKEAVLKAAGIGLHGALNALSVDCSPIARPLVRRVPQDFVPAASWTLVALEPRAGFIGAFATPSYVRDLTCMTWTS